MKFPSMKNASTRALTFLKYPGLILIRTLVAWGLFYTGNNRDLQCFYCGHIFTEWRENDDAKFRHLQEYPSCKFFQQMKIRDESVNIPNTATNLIFRIDLLQRSLNNLPQPTPPRHMFVGDEVEGERHIDVRTREGRLSTFTDWPKNDIIRPEELATAGFKYLHSDDRVQCVFCRGILKNWQVGDRALDEHKKFFIDCPFLESLDNQREPSLSGNRPNQNNNRSKPIGNADTAKIALGNMENKTLRSINARAKYPLFSHVESRIVSFDSEEWKQQALPQPPRDFATAGLFYTGPKDRVRCFSCGGGLQEWSSHDIPLDEHRRWYPECFFIEQLENETIRLLTNQLESSAIEDTPQNPHLSPEETPEGKYLMEMGYEPDAICRGYRTLENAGKTDIKASDILDEIFKEEENGPSTSNEGGPMSTCDSNERQERDPQEQNIDVSSQSSSTRQAQIAGSDVTASNGINDPAYEAELTENEKLRQMFYCWHCKDKLSTVLFLPCSHMIYCQDCYQGNAGNLICAKCNSHVRGIVKTYTG